MANAFVAPAVSGLNPSPLITIFLQDTRFPRAARDHYNRDHIPQLEWANSFYCPAGVWPARGWILVPRYGLDLITKYSNTYRTDFQLWIEDLYSGNQLIFNDLAIVEARCVTRGTEGNPNAMYLVEITDARGLLWNPFFASPLNAQYNVLSPAYPGEYYASSLVSGVTPWTWATMLDNLWSVLPAAFGTFPGLPTTPSGLPTNFIFPGVPLWLAINRILDLLGYTISVNLTNTLTSPYSIVALGAADTSFAALSDDFDAAKEDDFEFIAPGSGRIPGSVTVFFHRRNQYFGTEETVRNDALQWSSTPAYTVSVPAPAAFTNAVGAHYLWDDYPVQFDVNGVILTGDATLAAAIALERATQYYNRVFWATSGSMRRVYTGALPFAAGSLVSGVRWFEDFQTAGALAWKTEIVRREGPPWPQVDVERRL